MSVMIITLELSGSESIDNGLVRLASEYRAHDEERCHAVVQAALGLKLASGAILLVAWWLLWDRWLGGRGWRPELAEAVMFGVLGGVCGSFWRYCLAITQVYESFRRYALINIIPNALKLAAVVGLNRPGFSGELIS